MQGVHLLSPLTQGHNSFLDWHLLKPVFSGRNKLKSNKLVSKVNNRRESIQLPYTAPKIMILEPTSNGLSLKMMITLFDTYFESIIKWLPEALGLYKIIFDAGWILSLLLFTLACIWFINCFSLLFTFRRLCLQP